MPNSLITKPYSTFFQFELENGDARRKKVALQELSRQLRSNKILIPESQNNLETLICGLILQEKQDHKVVRWCLNCLAQFGRKNNSGHYVSQALRLYESVPEIVAAGVAAHCKLYSGLNENDNQLGEIDPKIKILAALQNTNPKNLDLSNFRINIDIDDKEILKLALIAIGMSREIENLFDPKYSNGEIVKILCQHDDSIVSQYSVWAILENNILSIDDLGLSKDKIDSFPVNVQAKILQLVAEKETDPNRKHATIADGQFFSSDEARMGLAKGLRQTFYDGVEEVTIGWFDQEISTDIQEILAEHFAKFSNACAPYDSKAEEIFTSHPRFKNRLLMASEGLPLFRRLKALDVRSDTIDMFGDDDEFRKSLASITSSSISRENRKLLLLSAAPLNLGPIQVDEECDLIRACVEKIKKPKITLDITFKKAVRNKEIQHEILKNQPEILHFIGHGDNKVLCFLNEQGNEVSVLGTSFTDLIELNTSFIKCVILNACHSFDICKQLKGKGVFLIGYDAELEDRVALAYSRGFYTAIANGRSYEEAHKFGKNEVNIENNGKYSDKYHFIS